MWQHFAARQKYLLCSTKTVKFPVVNKYLHTNIEKHKDIVNLKANKHHTVGHVGSCRAIQSRPCKARTWRKTFLYSLTWFILCIVKIWINTSDVNSTFCSFADSPVCDLTILTLMEWFSEVPFFFCPPSTQWGFVVNDADMCSTNTELYKRV
jgi:hypothetical protein